MSGSEGKPADLRDLSSLRPPCCQHGLSLLEVLDAARNAYRDRRWLRFNCPGCGRPSLLSVEADATAWGDVDGTRGRVFTPTLKIQQSGLRVAGGPEGLIVSLLHRRWFFSRSDD